MNHLVPFTDRAPALVAADGARASYRFFEFFTAQHSQPAHPPRLCARGRRILRLASRARRNATHSHRERPRRRPISSSYIRARSAPTAKLRLAALRHLFDWMVIGQIMPTNPASAVRGPRHIVRRGKTPVLTRPRRGGSSTRSTRRPSSACATAP